MNLVDALPTGPSAARPAAAPRRPAAPPAAIAPDRFVRPSIREINVEAGTILVGALREMARQPGRTLKSFGALLVEPFVHPGRAIARCADAFRADGWLQGGLYSLLYLSTAITTASFAVTALALLAAPFTGGATLAVVPLASQVMIWTGIHDALVCTALLFKDEYDASHADSEEALAHEEEQLADDFLNTFFAWATLPLTDAATAVTAAPQGLWLSARSAVKPTARSAGRNASRAATDNP